MKEICCIEAQNTLKLQVRETFSCTTVREIAADFFGSRGHDVGQGVFKCAIPWFVRGGV